MEAVCVALGEKGTPSWDVCRASMRKEGFISSIVHFDTELLTDKVRIKLKKNYLSNPDFTFEKVNRSSKACGPLSKWLSAQCHYAEILDKVQPLRDQVEALTLASEDSVKQLAELEVTVKELEAQIQTYKEEYAALINETQIIKTELESVKNKVDRCRELISSLAEESTRWEEGSASFQGQMSTVAGDVLLSAAFMAYIGYFDEMVRNMLLTQWSNHLTQAGIKTRSDLSVIEYLSSPGDRVKWHSQGLPTDMLCEQNAIMLNRFNRYPLLIDPAGVATEFLCSRYAERKIVSTSFLDSAFLKSLESAMRFGNPIIIQDVENIDPILNTVLNKELHKTGGRILVRLGDQDIDFSPDFQLFLVTRDPTFNFTPDICSRVTFVNFTITPSSLQNQCLNKVLKVEQPEVDKRRSDLLKLQGEFRVRLRELEDSLLNTLNSSEGNIIESQSVLSTLETLKKESGEVKEKAAQTASTMEQVEQTSNMYLPLALACSRLYFAMESLADIHFFYQFSLKFFLQIFNDVIINNKNLDGVSDPQERLEKLTNDLFNVTFTRVSRGMQNQDAITLALRIAQIRLMNSPGLDLDEAEVNALLIGAPAGSQASLNLPADVFHKDQREQLELLAFLPAFKFLEESIDTHTSSWAQFISHSTPEKAFPAEVLTDTQQPRVMWQRMLLIRAVRPDRFLNIATDFVTTAMGTNLLERAPLNLAAVVAEESDRLSPLLLCSMPGYDASSKVDELARTLSKQYKSIALGSPEGYELAEKSVTAAAKSGTWVLLKNIHLAPEWLMRLEKQLHRLNKHPDFRLFFTMEMNPCVPRNVIRISQTFVFEPPAGIKASLKRTFASITPERMEAAPMERGRIYILLAWFNALVQERKRYCPVGWTKRYEFSDNDLKHGLDTIDYWIDVAAAGRSNIAPEKIPWHALRQILCHVIYGGRVDNMFDKKALSSFIHQFFQPDSYNQDFSLVRTETVPLPDGKKYADVLSWINALPDDQPPTWLGLSSNAELILSVNHGKKVIKELQMIQEVVKVGDEDDLGDVSGADDQDALPMWLRTLAPFVNSWMEMLPKQVKTLDSTALTSPIERFLDREISFGLNLYTTIKHHLQEVAALCKGDKVSQAIRDIALELSKGLVPSPWRKYACIDYSMSSWLPNLVKRLEQLDHLQDNISNIASMGVWLGGLFSPEAFVTATRQLTAQHHSWALEQLELEVQLGSESTEEDCFTICDLNLENATVSGAAIKSSDDITTVIPKTTFRWVQQSGNQSNTLSLPVYLDSSRKTLLLTIGLEVLDPESAYNCSIAIIASS